MMNVMEDGSVTAPATEPEPEIECACELWQSERRKHPA